VAAEKDGILSKVSNGEPSGSATKKKLINANQTAWPLELRSVEFHWITRNGQPKALT